ncbi:hypothetical protein CTA2_2559 [Colletotrichum tanaceti]|nr:hypothetical protein CTA2_2559 [Colletotrichum tanaceti]
MGNTAFNTPKKAPYRGTHEFLEAKGIKYKEKGLKKLPWASLPIEAGISEVSERTPEVTEATTDQQALHTSMKRLPCGVLIMLKRPARSGRSQLIGVTRLSLMNATLALLTSGLRILLESLEHLMTQEQ